MFIFSSILKFVKFILGASPAKFMSFEDILKMNSSLEKMAIVHEIAIDKNFTVIFYEIYSLFLGRGFAAKRYDI